MTSSDPYCKHYLIHIKKRISQHGRIRRVWYTGPVWQYSYLNTSYDNNVAVLKLHRKRINSQTLDLEIALNQTLPYKNNSGRSQHLTNEVLCLQDLEMQGKRRVWIGEKLKIPVPSNTAQDSVQVKIPVPSNTSSCVQGYTFTAKKKDR